MADEPLYFIAHAAADVEPAKRLKQLLLPDVSSFVDATDLAPGTQWPQALARAQHAARATVALISPRADSAYYLGEEIAAAIAYQRSTPQAHRLIAVYLEGYPRDPEDVLYGLRTAHALDALRLGGLDGVATELKRLAPELARTRADVAPAPVQAPATVDRVQLLTCMKKLLDPQFEELLFVLDAPHADLPPGTVETTTRAISLIQWARNQGPGTLAALADAVRRFLPTCLG